MRTRAPGSSYDPFRLFRVGCPIKRVPVAVQIHIVGITACIGCIAIRIDRGDKVKDDIGWNAILTLIEIVYQVVDQIAGAGLITLDAADDDDGRPPGTAYGCHVDIAALDRLSDGIPA